MAGLVRAQIMSIPPAHQANNERNIENLRDYQEFPLEEDLLNPQNTIELSDMQSVESLSNRDVFLFEDFPVEDRTVEERTVESAPVNCEKQKNKNFSSPELFASLKKRYSRERDQDNSFLDLKLRDIKIFRLGSDLSKSLFSKLSIKK